MALLFLTSPSAGQPSLGFSKATMIKKNGDTLNCYVELSAGYERSIKYKLEHDGEELTMGTTQVLQIKTAFQIYENVPVNNHEKLMVLVVDGPIKLYKTSYVNVGKLGPPRSINYFGEPFIDYVIKADGKYEGIKEKNFREVLSAALKDCKQVVSNINNKVYNYSELENAVNDYYNCSAKGMDAKFLGTWKADSSDETTRKNLGDASMTFTNGNIIYTVTDKEKTDTVNLIYHIKGDVVVTTDPGQAEEQVAKFRFEGDDKLILEFNGMRSVFLRKKT